MYRSLGLFFTTSRHSDLPSPAAARIEVQSYTGKSDDHIFVSPVCLTFREVEHEVDRLIRELNKVKAEAKRRFVRERRGPA